MLALSMLLLLTTILAACSSTNSPSSSVEETRTLRIGVPGEETFLSTLKQKYVDSYVLAQNGNVQVELIAADSISGAAQQDDAGYNRYNNLVKLLSSEDSVDVVLLPTGDSLDTLRRLVQDNQVKALDPYIADNNYDLTDYSPAPLAAIKAVGDGEIYGLAPYFNTQALLINKTLFQEKGVSSPDMGAAWSNVFELGRQVASGDGADKAYAFGDDSWGIGSYWLTDTYARQLQLRPYNNDATAMTVNTEPWEQVLTEIIGLYHDDVLITDEALGMEEQGLWNAGKLAMKETNYTNLRSMEVPFEWEVITMPVHLETPDNGSTVSTTGLVAINSNADNTEDAWNYIAYLNGEEWSRIKAASPNADLVSRLSAQQASRPKFDVDALNGVAVYSVDYVQEDLMRTRPGTELVNLIFSDLFAQLKTGDITVPEALIAWEEQGNAVLGLSQAEVDTWREDYYAAQAAQAEEGAVQ
jgi:multiple sugar transport system substrate-binding protein